MTSIISIEQRVVILAELVKGELDLVGLCEKHHLDHEALSRWMLDEENRQSVEGLCMLANVQAQLLLARYRSLAASRLYELATQSEDRELVRKASVDLLKITLHKVDENASRDTESSPAPQDMMNLMYGAMHKTDQDDTAQMST